MRPAALTEVPSPATAVGAAAPHPEGLHVGIIMDGNGRWAQARGLPRRLGHRAGARAVRRAVERAPRLGIATLTLFAFSSDNWRRPPAEVAHLLDLFEDYLHRERGHALEKGLRVSVIGRRDRLPSSLVEAIATSEAVTAGGARLHLRLAVDYSGRDAILAAAALAAAERPLDREAFERTLLRAVHSPPGVPPLDLLIRTGGEQRLSDFLLWESAYAELWFTDRLWPDFTAADLAAALDAFAARDRRFGSVAPGDARVAEPPGDGSPASRSWPASPAPSPL